MTHTPDTAAVVEFNNHQGKIMAKSCSGEPLTSDQKAALEKATRAAAFTFKKQIASGFPAWEKPEQKMIRRAIILFSPTGITNVQLMERPGAERSAQGAWIPPSTFIVIHLGPSPDFTVIGATYRPRHLEGKGWPTVANGVPLLVKCTECDWEDHCDGSYLPPLYMCPKCRDQGHGRRVAVKVELR